MTKRKPLGESIAPELDPVLPHNRERYDALLWWKQLVAVIGVVVVPVVTLITPNAWRVRVGMGGLALIFLSMIALEVGRFMLFRRDLRERH